MPWAFAVEVLGERATPGVGEVLLDPRERERRLRCELARDLAYAPLERFVVDDLGDEADALRLLGVDPPVEQVELARLRLADEPRERPRAAEVAREPGRQEGCPEDGRARGNADVGGAREREAGARGGAVHCSDRRLRHLAQELA